MRPVVGAGGRNGQFSFLVLLLILLLVLSGCNTPRQGGGQRPSTAFRTLTDARGKTLTLSAPPRRIVSLAPGNTELLFALGLADRIAAVTDACDYPPEAKQKPNIGGAYNMSVERVLAFSPDLVVGDDSVNARALAALEAAGVPTLALRARNIEGVYDALRLLGKAAGVEPEAERVVSGMRARLDAVEKATRDVSNRPRVLILYGLKPIYTTGPGSFITDIVRAAGGTPVPEKAVANNTLAPEQVMELRPDVIICGPELATEAANVPGWKAAVPAVRAGHFFRPIGEAELVRPTPRLAAAAEQLGRFLHPDKFRQ